MRRTSPWRMLLAAFLLSALAVTDRKSLAADKLVAERIPLGEPDDYKPCIARLPSGELLLTAFHQHKRDGNKV
ncbi:MAG: hypothetical protein NT069_03885, partial [Planctomycetota bacterium]|nr:hypothetical protein [Planctomycetota bacterium]